MNTDLTADFAAAQRYLSDPSVPDEIKAQLRRAMGIMRVQQEGHARVANRGPSHARQLDPAELVQQSIAARYAALPPAAPVGATAADNEEYKYALAEEQAFTDLYAIRPELFPEEPSWGDKAASVGGALLEAIPEIAQYLTPVMGNLKGGQDFGNTFEQYLNVRDKDPLGALTYLPQLAVDGAQALSPIGFRGAADEFARLGKRVFAMPQSVKYNAELLKQYLTKAP